MALVSWLPRHINRMHSNKLFAMAKNKIFFEFIRGNFLIEPKAGFREVTNLCQPTIFVGLYHRVIILNMYYDSVAYTLQAAVFVLLKGFALYVLGRNCSCLAFVEGFMKKLSGKL